MDDNNSLVCPKCTSFNDDVTICTSCGYDFANKLTDFNWLLTI